jgi:hypothetical protein
LREERGSDYTLVAIADPGVLIVSAEAISEFNSDVIEAQFVANIRRVGDLPAYRRARFIVAIENLTGLEHERIAKRLLVEFPTRVLIMREKELKTGVCTTHAVKKNMMELTRALLAKRQVYLSSEFITMHPNRIKLFQEWKEQLARYREFKEPPKDAFSKGRQAWSGKINGMRAW